MANAIKMKLFKGGDVMCLYNEPMWAIADMGLFFCMWALLLFMCHLVRHVRDQLGEYLAIRRALFLSLGSLAFTIIAEILQIDGLCLGRSIITASVMVSTTSFFVLQNYDALSASMKADGIGLFGMGTSASKPSDTMHQGKSTTPKGHASQRSIERAINRVNSSNDFDEMRLSEDFADIGDINDMSPESSPTHASIAGKPADTTKLKQRRVNKQENQDLFNKLTLE